MTRQPGLDTLRAAAIVGVWLYHYQVFVSHEATFGAVGSVGWVGVDLFFVLSGYLITSSIFSGAARGQVFSVPAFYARRALRTLPVFWLVLALYFLFPADLGGRTPPALWRFLTFTQNLGLQPGTAFSHAWSLCIEEQFYLVLPLVWWLGMRGLAQGAGQGQGPGARIGVQHGWCLLAALCAVGIGARWLLWRQYGQGTHPQTGYYPHIYYATVCRFDELLPGIAVAMVQHFHAPLWQRLMAHGPRLLAAGAAASAVMLWVASERLYEGAGYGFFMTVFGYTLLAWAFALLVVAALAPGSALRWRVPGAQSLALWSYAIYLSHRAVAHVLQQRLRLDFGMDAGAPATMALLAAASVGVGWLLFRAVESPFMALRRRWVPTHFLPAPARQSLQAASP